MSYLLDTNHCVYLKNAMHRRAEYRKEKEQKVLTVFNHMREIEKKVYISMASIGEMYYGAENSQYRERNHQKLEFFLEYIEIEETNREVWELYGKTRAQIKKIGKSITDLDLLIACTAKINGHILVSEDSDYDNLSSEFLKENWVQT